MLQEPCALSNGDGVMADVVHLLRGGAPLCGKPGPPGHWTDGDRWVAADHDELGPRSAANCTACLAADAGCEEPEQDWFFTFGPAHHMPGLPAMGLGDRFVRLNGTRASTRAAMVRAFGVKWSGQYPSADAAGVERFGLLELAYGMRPRPRLASEAVLPVPPELHDAYREDATVQAHFQLAMRDGLPLDGVLIALVKTLLAEKATLTTAVLSYAKNAPPPVLHFEGPPPVWLEARVLAEPSAPELHLDRELMAAVLAWRAQGRKSKWTTAPSVHLVEVVDRLRERYPDLCAALMPEAATDG
jgi:hypothetical protein